MANFIRNTGTENLLLVAIDVAKYTHKVMICTFYGDILVKPFEFDASSLTEYEEVKKLIRKETNEHHMKEVIVGGLKQ